MEEEFQVSVCVHKTPACDLIGPFSPQVFMDSFILQLSERSANNSLGSKMRAEVAASGG